MKLHNLCLAVLVLLVSCNEETQTITAEQSELFMGSWIQLTESPDGNIIFNPCDAENQSIEVAKNDGEWLFTYKEGHEMSIDTIVGVLPLKNGHQILMKPGWSSDTISAFAEITSDKTIDFTWNTDGEMGTLHFVKETWSEDYPVVDQPCVECWGVEGCDPAEKDSNRLYSIHVYPYDGSGTNAASTYDTVADFDFIEANQYRILHYNYTTYEIRLETDTFLMLILGSNTISLSKSAFVPEAHALTYIDDESGYLFGIDDQEFYGTDAGNPRFELSNILIETPNPITFPKAQYDDLYEPNLSGRSVKAYETDGGELILTMGNSDGAGGYFVTWIIRGDVIERFVQSGI
ncbi:MAG: hypothetical protein KC456_01225 [Flavobacteriales bacterium]|nr:hypothetical protein [Flavobacteriales bacterium]